MTDQNKGVWRDEERLPLSELAQAMGSYSQDGQVDDLSGSDAGAEAANNDGSDDPTSAAGRGARPSPDGTTPLGRTGPN